jgi:hypothetical protein
LDFSTFSREDSIFSNTWTLSVSILSSGISHKNYLLFLRILSLLFKFRYEQRMMITTSDAEYLIMIYLQKRLNDLHQSQMKAYREAATKAIQEWALAFPLEPMEEGDTEQSFVDRCVSALVFVPSPKGTSGGKAPVYTWPNWKVDNGKALASNEVRKRAKAIYEKYRPVNDNGDEEEGEEGEEHNTNDADMADDGDDGETGDDDDDSEDDDENEEGEEGKENDGEAGGVDPSTSAGSKNKQQQGKNNINNNRNKRKGGNTKNATVRKKVVTAKGYRNKGGQAARRRGGGGGGRGGGNNRKSN